MAAKVLVLGGGGREHALAWKLSLSPHVSCVYVAPGNAGIPLSGRIARTKDVNSDDHASLVSWCLEKVIDLVVVGPEAPLANGIADSLASANVRCFGPSASAARIESSKKFAKEFMQRHGIPTARWETFDSDEIDAACRHIDEGASYSALVVKASGLAAGKGVVVARDKDEAKRAVMDMLQVCRRRYLANFCARLLSGFRINGLVPLARRLSLKNIWKEKNFRWDGQNDFFAIF